MVERSLGVREVPGSIPGSPNLGFHPSIAFFYSHSPSGHSSAAYALQESFRERTPEARTSAWSLSADYHPILGPLVNRLYLGVVRNAPWLWSSVYDNRAISRTIRRLYPPPGFRLNGEIGRRLDFRALDLIVCTHALALAALAFEKRKGRFSAGLVGVLTDFSVHDYWISPDVDLYLVPTAEIRDEMARRGIDPSRIKITGIPIHPRFQTPPPSSIARRALGLGTNRPTVLVAGGSKGIGPLRDIALKLLSAPVSLQVIVACGNNRPLFRWCQKLFKERAVANLKAVPFTYRMDLCLAAADLLVGKAGGVTLAEALAVGVPAIILSPLPGQEERNAKFLVGKGVARLAGGVEEMAAAVAETLGSKSVLSSLHRAALRLGRPDSSEAACRAIGALLAERNNSPGFYWQRNKVAAI